jgi:hypothetical protein
LAAVGAGSGARSGALSDYGIDDQFIRSVGATLEPGSSALFVLVRGVTNNLAASVGTAVMGALVVGLLSAAVMSSLTENPIITTELQAQVELDNLDFVSNDRLEERLKSTTATPEQVAEAVRINTEARLRALKIAFFVLGLVFLLATFPARALPRYVPGDVPSGQAQGLAGRSERQSA